MGVNLDRMLAAVKAGQWSVDDFDWSEPLQGAEGMSRRDRREAGFSLLFTAGLERQAARVFDLAAHYAEDDRAREIYRYFAEDERRHADAETRLAARYGAAHKDLPLPLRWTLATLGKDFDQPNRGLHELTSATIVLFELALDTLLIPALKERVDDPLQAAVFRKIDLDESRHLAMDYWLLDNKAELYEGTSLQELVEAEQGPLTLRRRVVGRFKLLRALVVLMVGFGTTAIAMPSMRKAVDEEKFAKYLKRVDDIPNKAKKAWSVPTFQMGMKGQRIIVNMLMRFEGRSELRKKRASA
jgi:hypothetical protein